MKKFINVFFLSILLSLIFITPASAQMMGATGNPIMQGLSETPTITPTQQDIQDIQTGKDLYTKFKNQQISCIDLKDDDFEKIGEYIMQQSFGDNTTAHLQMNSAMEQMMGQQGEEQMHIRLAKNTTGCFTTGRGGVRGMMGYWSGPGSMMGWNAFSVFSFFGGLLWLVLFIDFILLGVVLFKQIRKNK